jgi:hypothetical protein
MKEQCLPEVHALFDKVRAYWLEKGVKPRPGLSTEQIQVFEARNQIHLPPDLSAWYTTTDGMDDGESDPDMFCFLPLKAVKPIPEELADFGGKQGYRGIMRSLPEPHRWFVIVDYFIRSAVYAIRLSATAEPAPILCIGSGQEHRLVATSFSRFLEVYLANCYDLLP